MGEFDGVILLEEKAADLCGRRDPSTHEVLHVGRLDPSTREAHVAVAVAALREKFTREYGTAPPASMVTEVEAKTGAANDAAVLADLEALKSTAEVVGASLARAIVAAEELPDAVREAEIDKGNVLTFEQRHSVQSLDEIRMLNLRTDLAGGGFARVLAMYRRAAAANDRPTLRFLERQRVLQWPGVVRDGAEVDAELEVERLIVATRAGRVPSELRDAHARTLKVWNLQLDTIHRTWNDRGLRLVTR